jgi:hypothetical protein
MSIKITDLTDTLHRIKLLLDHLNTYWAIELTDAFLLKLEGIGLSPTERLNHINDLAQIWEQHLQNMEQDFYPNWAFIYTAYGKLFDILFMIKDNYRIVENGLKLGRNLVKIQFAAPEQIAAFLESLAHLTLRTKNIEKAIELIFLSIYFRGAYLRSPVFDACFGQLDRFFIKLPIKQRAILLSCFLETSFESFFGGLYAENEIGGKFQEYLNTIYRATINTYKPAFRECFSTVKKNFTIFRGQGFAPEDLAETISTLQLIKEDAWAFAIAQYYIKNLIRNNERTKALQFLNIFRDRCFRQGAYDICLQTCDFQMVVMEEIKSNLLLLSQATIWIEWAGKFQNLTDQTCFVTSIHRIADLLVNSDLFQDYPWENAEEFRLYLNNMNQNYNLKRGLLPIISSEFWWAMLYRSIFEEGFIDIAEKCLAILKMEGNPMIDQFIKENIAKTTEILLNNTDPSLDPNLEGETIHKIAITIRIPLKQKGKIHTRFQYQSGLIRERLIYMTESWDQSDILLVRHSMDDFTTNPGLFGRLTYLCSPLEFRQIHRAIKIPSSIIPEMFIITNIHDSVPLELMYDQKAPLGIKYAFGYRFREPKLIAELTHLSPPLNGKDANFHILSISDFNSHYPQIWNDGKLRSEPFLASQDIIDQARRLSLILDKNKHFIAEFKALSGDTVTFLQLQEEITTGNFHILNFSSNLFYLPESPIDSYFLLPDNRFFSIRDLNNILKFAEKQCRDLKHSFIRPLILFTGRVLGRDNMELDNCFSEISQILGSFESQTVRGIICKILGGYCPSFSDILDAFIERILLNDTVGIGLVTANRHQFSIARNAHSTDPQLASVLLNSPVYVFFGEPWI